MRRIVVTIDGPGGTGKSTVARQLAVRLGFQFLDTGAMYRAVACACLRGGIDVRDMPGVVALAESIVMSFDDDHILVDGTDLSAEIRTPEVTDAASIVADYPDVRTRLVALQRIAAEGGHFVTEGRDQGTVVFPQAECKFFLTADPRERAARRYREFIARGQQVSLDEVLSQLELRDRRDESREFSPLRPAEDALTVDTSHLSEEEVLGLLEDHVRSRMATLG